MNKKNIIIIVSILIVILLVVFFLLKPLSENNPEVMINDQTLKTPKQAGQFYKEDGSITDYKEQLEKREYTLRENYIADIEQFGRLKFFNELKEYFPDTEIGRALTVSMTLLDAKSFLKSPQNALFREAWNFIAASDNEMAFDTIDSGIKKLPSKHEEITQYLIQMATRFNVSKEKKFELLSEQMDKPMKVDQSGNPQNTFFTPYFALGQLIEINADPEKIEDILMKIISRLDNNTSKKFLLDRFSAFAPENGERVKERLGL